MSFASLLLASGANPKVIQSVMGHATIGMTFDICGHLMPEWEQEGTDANYSFLYEV